MSDYTPTTDEVKGHYAYSRICDGLAQEEADVEFDAWLAEHDRQVQTNEHGGAMSDMTPDPEVAE